VGENTPDRRKITQDPVDVAVRQLAGRQSGNVARRQLLSLGLGQHAINARLRNGSFVARYHGVYALAPARQDAQALIAAAVLAGGPTAVASHASAAWLWGFLKRWERPPEISLPTGDRRPRHILTHRCPSLQPRDMTRQRGVPTTTPARTALDLAPRLTRKQLTRLVNNARLEGYLKLAALEDVLARNPLRPGTKLLRPFVDHPTNPTRSGFEDAFPVFAAKSGLPRFEQNAWVNGREVDVLFREQRVIVELDSRDYHMDEEAFEDDRERDVENLKHGFITVRVTEERFENTPDAEAGRLLEILEAGSL
jgi:very-short-patch-repair endonuclease